MNTETTYSIAIGIALALAGSTVVIYVWHHHSRSKRKTNAISKALRSLEKARFSVASLDSEAYAAAICDILRSYLESHLGRTSPLQTSEDFLTRIAEGEASPTSEVRVPLREFLRQLESAKLISGDVDPAQREDLIEYARDFVTTTALTMEELGISTRKAFPTSPLHSSR